MRQVEKGVAKQKIIAILVLPEASLHGVFTSFILRAWIVQLRAPAGCVKYGAILAPDIMFVNHAAHVGSWLSYGLFKIVHVEAEASSCGSPIRPPHEYLGANKTHI